MRYIIMLCELYVFLKCTISIIYMTINYVNPDKHCNQMLFLHLAVILDRIDVGLIFYEPRHFKQIITRKDVYKTFKLLSKDIV